MDYEKKYKETLERAKSIKDSIIASHNKESASFYTGFINNIFPELKESEDERICNLIYCIVRDREDVRDTLEANGVSVDKALAYLEKQKEKTLCLSAEGRKRLVETIYSDIEEVVKGAEKRISYFPFLKSQKEQKPANDIVLQKAFINSKIDYTLEEKCDASDYADAILPTSVAYGENEEEYKLHKIIEAAFIAGQKKEKQPAEWSEEDEALIKNVCTALKGYALHERKVDLDEHAHRLEEMSERLKSLRPQHHWKPSEEQMKALNDVANDGVLLDLFNDLLKLM